MLFQTFRRCIVNPFFQVPPLIGMNKFRPEMTPAEQREFLTHTRLYLSKDVKRVVWLRDVYVLKHMPTGHRMRVSAEELFVLGQFGRGLTLAELIPQLIMNRRCLPLAKLYDLVLQARAANILNEQRDEEFAVDYPLRWWPSLTASSVQIIWMVVAFASVLVIPFGAFPELDRSELRWSELPVAWLVASLCASLGGLLASAYVHRAGADVRRPHFNWKTLLPRVGFDWHDVDMLGPDGHRIVAKLRILPFMVAAACCWAIPKLQVWAPIAVGLLLWRISPFPFTAASQWIQAAARGVLLASDRPRFFYHYSKEYPERLWREFLATDWVFTCGLCVWTLIWSASVIWFACMLVIGTGSLSSGFDVFSHLFAPESIALLSLVSPFMALVVALVIAVAMKGWWAMRTRAAGYGSAQSEPIPGGSDLLQVLEDSPLFREIPAEVRVQLVKMARVVTVRAGQPVVGIGEAGADFYIVATGRVEITLDRAKHKPDKVAVLHRGDVFGAFAFFGSLFRTQNAYALGEVSLVALSSPELEAILKRHISIPVIEEIVQKRAFLRRIKLSAGWEPESVMRFAKAARIESMREGQCVIGAGRENRFFYLVYDGGMEVKRRGRRIGRIAPGEFFGELSLLLNNLAGADIHAETNAKCMVLQKSDFLELMGNDIELALQMEHVASVRLGRSIFPFDGSSIEALAN